MNEDNGSSMESGGKARSIVILAAGFVVLLVIAIVLYQIVIINVGNTGVSMENTIVEDARVIGLRMSKSDDLQRFDVVIFKNPVNEAGEPYVRRIIGMPGETILIVKGKIYINTVPLDEANYLAEAMVGGAGPFTLPADCYFVLGDNRNYSEDSREFGPVLRKNIIGKAFLEVFPAIKSIK